MMDLFLFLLAVVGGVLLLIVGTLIVMLGLWGIVSVWKEINEVIK